MAKTKDSEEAVQIPRSGATAKMIISGGYDDLAERLNKTTQDGDESGEKKKSSKPKNNRQRMDELITALNDPNNRCRAIRLYPTVLEGRPLKNMIPIPCPTNMNNIEDRITRELGGERWHIEVFDSYGEKITGIDKDITSPVKEVFESTRSSSRFGGEGTHMGSSGFSIPDDDEEEEEDAEEEMFDKMLKHQRKMLYMKKMEEMMGGDKKDESKSMNTIKDLIRDMKDTAKERDRQIHDELKEMSRIFGDRIKGVESDATDKNRTIAEQIENSVGKFVDKIGLRIDQIEKDKSESKHQKTIDALQAKFTERETMSQLKDQMTQISADMGNKIMLLSKEMDSSKSGKNDKAMEMIFKTMMDSSNKSLDAISKTMDSRMESSANSNKDWKDLFITLNNQKSGDPLSSAGKIIEVASGIAGIARPGGDENLPFESRLLKAFTEVTPQVMDYFNKKQKADGTEQFTEDQIKDMMEKKAQEAADDILKTAEEQANKAIAAQERKQIPPPKDEHQQQQQQPQQQQPQQQPDQLPQQETVEAKKEEQPVNPEEELRKRVHYILEIIIRELDVRPMNPEWCEHALDLLPEEHLRKLAESEKPDSLLPLIEKYATPLMFGKIAGKLVISKPRREWLEKSVKILQRMIRENIAEQEEVKPEIVNDDDDAGEIVDMGNDII